MTLDEIANEFVTDIERQGGRLQWVWVPGQGAQPDDGPNLQLILPPLPPHDLDLSRLGYYIREFLQRRGRDAPNSVVTAIIPNVLNHPRIR